MDNDYNAALNSQHTRLPETHRPYSSETNVEPMWIFSCTHDLYKKEDNKFLRFKKCVWLDNVKRCVIYFQLNLRSLCRISKKPLDDVL